MTDDAKRPAGWPRAVVALSGMLLVAGCQSGVFSMVGGAGNGVGVSASSETTLAEVRSEHGLPPLVPDAKLEKAAAEQAGYMARASRMSHKTGWRKDFATRMHENGVEGAAAENVGYGAMSQGKLFSMWMASKGHRRNMLDPRFGHYGLASADDGRGRKYWALVLGR